MRIFETTYNFSVQDPLDQPTRIYCVYINIKTKEARDRPATTSEIAERFALAAISSFRGTLRPMEFAFSAHRISTGCSRPALVSA